MKISMRQTQKGDWLVFEAIPATMGVGVSKVGTLAGGYTTGLQLNRFDNEELAYRFAAELSAKTGSEIVDWLPPQAQNVQFRDLPKLYPTAKRYDTSAEAEADGWIHINPSKSIDYHKSIKIYCADVSPVGTFGYNLAIMADGRRYAESSTIWIGQHLSIRFRAGEIVDAIEAIRRFIDSDLITQAEAADLVGLTVASISLALDKGNLREYINPGAPTRQGRRLVSRAAVRELWPNRSQVAE